jgi:hypothetical protein
VRADELGWRRDWPHRAARRNRRRVAQGQRAPPARIGTRPLRPLGRCGKIARLVREPPRVRRESPRVGQEPPWAGRQEEGRQRAGRKPPEVTGEGARVTGEPPGATGETAAIARKTAGVASCGRPGNAGRTGNAARTGNATRTRSTGSTRSIGNAGSTSMTGVARAPGPLELVAGDLPRRPGIRPGMRPGIPPRVRRRIRPRGRLRFWCGLTGRRKRRGWRSARVPGSAGVPAPATTVPTPVVHNCRLPVHSLGAGQGMPPSRRVSNAPMVPGSGTPEPGKQQDGS